MTTESHDPEQQRSDDPPLLPDKLPPDKLRRRIATEAARGMAGGSDTRRAVFRAARRVARGWVPADRLPEAQEVRSELARLRDTPLPAASADVVGDRFDVLATLVAPLATVRRNLVTHPEGDALEHSLQVFALVHAERPFDEELLTAALVHDVGLAIDRTDPVAAGLAALGDLVTPRTRWLVEAVPAAAAYGDRPVTNGRRSPLGHRARQRLAAHPDFEDALLLAEADRRGRVRGGVAPSLDEAIALLRALDAMNESDGAADGDG
jgi:hypothetical protein